MTSYQELAALALTQYRAGNKRIAQSIWSVAISLYHLHLTANR